MSIQKEMAIESDVRLDEYFIISTNPEVIAFFEKNKHLSVVTDY